MKNKNLWFHLSRGCSWGFGVIFIIMALIEASKSLYTFAVFLILGLFLLPPISNKLEQILKIKLSGWRKPLFTIILFVSFSILGAISNSDERKDSVEVKDSGRQEVEITTLDAEKSNTEEINKEESFMILNQWDKGDMGETGRPLTSTGFEILIDKKLSKEEIVQIVDKLSQSDSSIFMKVFSSRVAYLDDKAAVFENTEEYKKGYILAFSKSPNGSVNGQITWMQEMGKFQDIYGVKEEL